MKRLRPSKVVGQVRARSVGNKLPRGLVEGHVTPQACLELAVHYLAEARCLHEFHKVKKDGLWVFPCTPCVAWATEQLHAIIATPEKKR